MSEPKAKRQKASAPIPIPDAKPKRQRKPKAKLTKQEMLKILQDSKDELNKIVVDLKDDEMKLQGMQLKQVFPLIQETLKNLAEDLEEIDEEYKHIESSPDVCESN